MSCASALAVEAMICRKYRYLWKKSCFSKSSDHLLDPRMMLFISLVPAAQSFSTI